MSYGKKRFQNWAKTNIGQMLHLFMGSRGWYQKGRETPELLEVKSRINGQIHALFSDLSKILTASISIRTWSEVLITIPFV